jgi:hypothetical protein
LVDAEKEKLYKERQKRFDDVIALRVPDRVPVTANFYFFPARYYGYTVKEVMYDPQTLIDIHLRATLEFQPDVSQNLISSIYVGPLLDVVDYRQSQWAGRQLGPDVPFQFVEGEYMKAEEYDHFFSDPADFIARVYWPRVFGVFKPFGNLPPFRNLTTFTTFEVFGIFASPQMREALEAMNEAGREMEQIGHYSRVFEDRMREEGFPVVGGGFALAPFDRLGDTLRGMKGIMLDMYRRPTALLKAVEMLLPLEIEKTVSVARMVKSPFVHIPLHKGPDGFMSPAQFEKFYWPTLRELIVALINEGLTPHVFWEGDCTSRLHLINDIPPGKAIYRFEATDIFKAKDALRDRVCIRGNVPISLLATATPEHVKAYCKKLIDYVGKDGGLIVDASAGVDNANPENLRAMFEFSREYGTY